MEILKEVLAELFSMFVTDARLTLSTLALVLVVAALTVGLGLQPLIGGLVLLVGCIGIVVEATIRETQKRAQR